MLRRSFLGHSLIAGAGFGLLGVTPRAWAQAGRPGAPATNPLAVPDNAIPVGKLSYTVMREGSDIGTHVMNVARSGDSVTVDSETNIAVKVMMITAYRFEQTAREVWRAGRLVELSATTNDDGTKNKLEAAARDNNLVLNVDGKTATIPATVLPASLWNPKLVQQSKLFDTADGRQLNVSVKFIGEESVTARKTKIAARHYSITGDVRRELWYDANWTPVQAHLLRPKDTTVVAFVLN